MSENNGARCQADLCSQGVRLFKTISHTNRCRSRWLKCQSSMRSQGVWLRVRGDLLCCERAEEQHEFSHPKVDIGADIALNAAGKTRQAKGEPRRKKRMRAQVRNRCSAWLRSQKRTALNILEVDKRLHAWEIRTVTSKRATKSVKGIDKSFKPFMKTNCWKPASESLE